MIGDGKCDFAFWGWWGFDMCKCRYIMILVVFRYGNDMNGSRKVVTDEPGRMW